MVGMTWFVGATMTDPAGHESSKKTGTAVVCDVCRLGTEFFSEAAVNRAGAEGIHRLLLKRGWEADLSTGQDACPTCTLEVAS